ncbi:unnamed protein product [Linum tenue]|uniref:Uncharacterized protein n=1 Tax=Linum tenue TaxID=586396 RepID=A0AAV0IMK1_9ROSI|nr:unnamed protein product [Linum tenue]
MDSHRNSLLTWAYFCHGKSMEELKHSLLYTTLELEQTRIAAQEELKKRDDQLIQLKEFLGKAIRERDDAQEKYQRVLLENLLLHQHQNTPPLSGISCIEDEPRRGIDSNNNGFSSSDCEESIVSSPVLDPIPPPPPRAEEAGEVLLPEPEKPLPEKGKLLQAVMKAGPLLQTLLLAGPLPQWRHPPPAMESFEIPPVTIPSPPAPFPATTPPQDYSLLGIGNGFCSRKRVVPDGGFCESPTETKFHRVVLH